jgi:glyoxylase-like metal-dependent hydrolase (beta-lactamase superfamily II)
VRDLGEGETIRTRHLALEILHMPGHTPGLLCAYDREARLILSDDHLLEKVSPNPLIELGPDGEPGAFKPLVAYLASVRRMRALEVDLVLPGHGPPFQDHRAVIDRLLAFYEKRQARVLELVGDGAPTPYEVALALFPKARTNDVFLTVSETIANLEVLEERGAIRRADDRPVRFRRAA